MLGYIIRRLLGVTGIFLLIAYAIWFLTTPTGYAAFHHLSFTALLPVDYLLWLQEVLHGDLGYSAKEQVPVISAIQSHVLATVLLVIPAFLLQQVIAIGVGVSAGVRPRSWFDRLAVGIATLLVAIPPFWLALLVVSLAILTQGWPALEITNLRMSGYAFNTAGYWHYFGAHPWAAGVDLVRHLTLPVIVLALLGAAGDGLYVRQRMIEVMRTDYIRAARARGLSRRAVRWQHGLRNALLPILTNITTQLPQLVFAAAIVEFVFQLPGIGWLFAHAVFKPPESKSRLDNIFDYNVLAGMLLLFAVVTLLSGLFTDILYALADPRIRTAQTRVGYVVNPLRSQQPLARMGPLTVRLGVVLSIGLVALGFIGAGLTANSIRELYAPTVGDWSGTLLTSYYPQNSQLEMLPAFVHLSIATNGKVQGQLYVCLTDDHGKHSIIMPLVGNATNRIAIDLVASLNTPQNEAGALVGVAVSGGYNGKQGGLDLTGQVSYAEEGYLAAELQVNPNGSLAQFQHACASQH